MSGLHRQGIDLPRPPHVIGAVVTLPGKEGGTVTGEVKTYRALSNGDWEFCLNTAHGPRFGIARARTSPSR